MKPEDFMDDVEGMIRFEAKEMRIRAEETRTRLGDFIDRAELREVPHTEVIAAMRTMAKQIHRLMLTVANMGDLNVSRPKPLVQE